MARQLSGEKCKTLTEIEEMKMRWKKMKKVPLICFKRCELKTKLGALCIFLRNDCDIMMSAHDYSHESNAVVFLKFNKPNFLMKKK